MDAFVCAMTLRLCASLVSAWTCVFTFPFGEGGPLAVDEVYLLTDVRCRKSDFLTKTSSVSLRLPPSPKGKVTRFCASHI